MNMADSVTVRVAQEDVRGELQYTLLRDVEVIEGTCVTVYGVAVAWMSGGRLEVEKVHNVTDDCAQMEELMVRMADGWVFPVCLMDIIEDFIP